MKQIRVIKNWKWPDLLKQTPGNRGVWENMVFTEDKIEEADYIIILNNCGNTVQTVCPLSNTWRVIQEPPSDWFKSWHQSKDYASLTFTCDPDRKADCYVQSHPMVPWHVNRSYDFLKSEKIPSKTRTLSWITTTKRLLTGHKIRMNFLIDVHNKINELELLGGQTHHIKDSEERKSVEEFQKKLGFKPISDKWEGLSPFRYSLAVENYSGPEYWTEKLADCFLSWTVPLYYGCTNLEDYFPEDSFIRININDSKAAAEKIKEIITKDNWQKRLPAISEARKRVLDSYQFFPEIVKQIRLKENERNNS